MRFNFNSILIEHYSRVYGLFSIDCAKNEKFIQLNLKVRILKFFRNRFNNPSGVKSFSYYKFSSLTTRLNLAVGSKINLTSNLWITKCLVKALVL